MSLLGVFFNRQSKGVLFTFPSGDNDIKNLKSAIQSFATHDNSYIRTVAAIMQKESRRNQYLILRIIQLLAHAQ